MFNLERIEEIIQDIFRTEFVRLRKDTFAFFDDTPLPPLKQIPLEISKQAALKAGVFFGFAPKDFSSLRQLAQQALNAWQKNRFIYLATSGSTGEPKQILYTAEMMEIEARCIGKHFKVAKRFITLTPRQHLYGITFAVFFPYVYNIPAFALPPIPLSPWDKLLKEGDSVAGFPLFWEYFLKAGNKFPKGITAITSTAPCPKGLFERLKQAGAETVAELYGATETGGIGVRFSEQEPFTINDYWDISTEQNPPLISRKGIEGWIDFPDEVRFLPPRGMFPLKRLDRAVQVAGVNVYPQAVEKVINKHPAVQECKVRLMRPEEGRRLKAFIVLKAGYTPKELPAIKAYLAGALSSHEMPRSFTFGPHLPVNSMGKSADW